MNVFLVATVTVEMPRYWWHWQLWGYKVSDELVGNSKTRWYLGFGWTCSSLPFSVRDLLLKTFATSKAIKLAQPAKFPAACSFYVAVSQRFNSVTHHHGTKSPWGCCCCNICLTSARVNHRASSISLGFTFPLRCNFKRREKTFGSDVHDFLIFFECDWIVVCLGVPSRQQYVSHLDMITLCHGLTASGFMIINTSDQRNLEETFTNQPMSTLNQCSKHQK